MAANGEIVGRDSELAKVFAFVESSAEGAAVLVLEGDVGIGKTTVWKAGVAAAEARGHCVLQARPAEAEAEFVFAGLGDLLAQVPSEAREALPEPQRRALAVALLEHEAGGRPLDARTVGMALLGVLRAMAATVSVLIAVDDVQWLDGPTAAALAFAVRRLRDEPVRMLATRRRVEERPPARLDWAVTAERLEIGPLSLGAVHRLLTQRLGVSLPRPLLRRVHETSGGNPFFALELARVLQREGLSATPSLHVPDDLHVLVDERISGLPPPTQTALLYAAAAADPTMELLEQALEAPPELEPAAASGLVDIRAEAIRFAHPLYSTAVYDRAPAEVQRGVHKRLAQVVVGREQRARHLALSATKPDAEVAAALEEAATRAHGRGAPAAAAELLDQALRLTPTLEGDDRIRRTLMAAETHFEAGSTARAEALLSALREALPAGRRRSRVLQRLGVVKGELESAPAAIELFKAALREVEGDSRLEAELHRDLAWMTMYATNLGQARAHARRAVELADGHPDGTVVAEILAAAVIVDFMADGQVRADLLERALALERGGPPARLDRAPTLVQGRVMLGLARLEAARACFETLLRQATDRGDESDVSAALFFLGLVELEAGNWTRARIHVEEGLDLTEQTGVNRQELRWVKGLLDARTGDEASARVHAEAGVLGDESTGEKLYLIRDLSLLGFIALSTDDHALASRHLRRACALADELGLGEPGLMQFVLDEAEALVGLGELDEAAAVLDRFERRARRLERGAALAAAERCRGLLLAARNDLPAALAALESAVAAHDRLPLPFERARTLLTLGSVQRRVRRRRAARESLEAALAGFEKLGAPLWAERARSELARIGGRTGSRDELTASEQRIAALVAEGKTNKEVAAELFVTVHTVEAALTRIYSKFGIRSRSELAAKLASKV